jgi:hypothetical protein
VKHKIFLKLIAKMRKKGIKKEVLAGSKGDVIHQTPNTKQIVPL